jgi:hypothetical protein
MASFYPCVKNHASGYTFYISLVSQANTKIMQANPTLAAGDVKIAIDDGAPANLDTLPVVDADFTKRVKVVLSQANTNGDNITLIFSDAAGAGCDLTINIQTVPYRFDNLDAAITSRMATYTQPTGFLAATFPTTVASTTNITAGTITTVTNLTNAPTSGDLTATMKTSVTTACTASTPTAAAVTGAVGSVTANVTVGGYAAGQTPADSILEVPANKLVTDANGYVTEASVDGIKKNTALSNFEFFMVDSTDHVTGKTGLTVTAERSIDGAAFGACANAVSEVSAGIYKINLATTDLNGDVITLKFTATGADARLVTIKTNV